jgi:orotate phosphoribosyltransferase
MTVAERVIQLLRETGALLEGHFALTSGLHSARYVQCARALQYPQHAETLGQWIAPSFHDHAIDVVASPAIGGIIIGHEVARALGVRAIFGEREGGVMTLRRGFTIAPHERVLVVEDVTTTGGSVREILHLVQAQQGIVVGVGTILDRGGGRLDFGVPWHALAALEIDNYAPEVCPLCQQGSQAVKPGSRQPA